MPLGEHSMNTHTTSWARVLSVLREGQRAHKREREGESKSESQRNVG